MVLLADQEQLAGLADRTVLEQPDLDAALADVVASRDQSRPWPYARTGARHSCHPDTTCAKKRFVGRVAAVAVGVSLLLASPIVLVGCGGKGEPAAAPTTTTSPHIRPLPANAIRIHWKKEALVPAPRPGRVCIVTVKTGHFCARYVFGEIPAVALKRKLRTKGWVVVTAP